MRFIGDDVTKNIGRAELPPHHNPNPVGRSCRSAIRSTNKTPGRAELPLRRRRGTAALPQSKSVGRNCRSAIRSTNKTPGRAELLLRWRRGTAAPPQSKSGRAELPLRHSFNKQNPR